MRMPVPSDRPTIPPSFDVEKFAKDSDARISAVAPAGSPPPPEPTSEVRLMTRPRIDAVTPETWARAMVGNLHVRLEGEALKRLPLDHRAGFLLSLMDGSLDIESLVEVSGMPRDEALRIVRDLHDSGVIDVR
ncbi:MAG TPA: hypothetical protein VF765_23135 [Polyangiaceae bacterium]